MELTNNKLAPCKNIDQIFKVGFQLCKKYNTKLCGIYSVQNEFFMDYSIHVGLYFIIGAMFWNIIDHDHSLKLSPETKEDYEQSLKYYIKYGSVIRFDNLTLKTNYYTEKGGLQELRTNKTIRNMTYYLINKYPQYCRLNKARKKHVELKFIKQPNNKKIPLTKIF